MLITLIEFPKYARNLNINWHKPQVSGKVKQVQIQLLLTFSIQISNDCDNGA